MIILFIARFVLFKKIPANCFVPAGMLFGMAGGRHLWAIDRGASLGLQSVNPGWAQHWFPPAWNPTTWLKKHKFFFKCSIYLRKCNVISTCESLSWWSSPILRRIQVLSSEHHSGFHSALLSKYKYLRKLTLLPLFTSVPGAIVIWYTRGISDALIFYFCISLRCKKIKMCTNFCIFLFWATV